MFVESFIFFFLVKSKLIYFLAQCYQSDSTINGNWEILLFFFLQEFKSCTLKIFFPKGNLARQTFFFAEIRRDSASFLFFFFNECLCLDKNFQSQLSTFSVTGANCTSQLLLCNVSKRMFSGQLDILCVLMFPASLLCLSAEFPAALKLIKIRVSRRQGKKSLCLLHLLDQLISLHKKHPDLKISFIALKSFNLIMYVYVLLHLQLNLSNNQLVKQIFVYTIVSGPLLQFM